MMEAPNVKNNLKKLSKIVDDRGWLVEVIKIEPSLPIEQIHFSISKPGAVRGNHYHKQRIEWLLVTNGTGKIMLEDNETKERTEATLSGEDPVLVEILPNVSHKIVNSGTEPMHLIIIESKKHSSSDLDTFKSALE